jgi:16S rRNA (cytosine1402-N4)-methyltransferase
MIRGRDTGSSGVAGGPAPHIPVLASRVIEYLAPHDGGCYLDATFGAGGHTRLILAAAACRVIGLDRDQSSVAHGFDLVEASGQRLVLIQERFSAMQNALASAGVAAVDGIVLDLGVSSMQLDAAERGFSFRQNGPLDMRMGGSGPTAADLVAAAPEGDLVRIIAALGEERQARAVARAVVRYRREAPIRTTRALADIVSHVVRGKPGEIHPATRTFQALRMFINEELQELVGGLAAAERMLKPRGRLVAIAFHSLEDRIVKQFLARRSRAAAVSRHRPEISAAPMSFRLLTPRPVVADAAELATNPRARSAKLRAAERTDAAVMPPSPDLLPRLPDLADVLKGR